MGARISSRNCRFTGCGGRRSAGSRSASAAFIEPRVLGVGYDTIHQLMRGDLLGPALLALLVAKAVVWAIALGSGTSGGVLAPLLIMGGALGRFRRRGRRGRPGSLGHGRDGGHDGRHDAIAPHRHGVRCRIDPRLERVPGPAHRQRGGLCVTVLLLRRSILTEKLARRGHHITREYSIDPLEFARVRDVMDAEIPRVPAHMPLSELADRIARGDSALSRRQGTLIVDDQDRLVGIITRGDIVRALRSKRNPEMTVAEAGSFDLVVAFPDEPLNAALTRMLERDIGRLPVVERRDPGCLVGYLGRAAVLSARMKTHEEETVRQRGSSFARSSKQPAVAIHGS